jgi:hypothetical protein
MEWYELDGNKHAWLRYLAAEREALMLRANGLLAHEGLLQLIGEDGSTSLKHIDDLTPDDVPAKRRAEMRLLGFLRERTRGHLERSGRRLFRPPRD